MLNLNDKKAELLIISIITVLVYINTLPNNFVWDDSQFIIEWDETRSFENVGKFMTGAIAPGHHGVYRPLRSVFYAISYKLWGLNPLGYHIQAILIHLISTLLVYFIILKIAKVSYVAFITSLLFGVHPIHTEAITYITASFDIIGVVFFLLAFYLYIDSNKICSVKYIASLTLAILAFFTYEMTLTLPIMMLLYELLLNKKRIIGGIKASILFFAVAIFYASVRVVLLDIGSRGDYIANSFVITMLIMVKAFAKYVYLSIYPVNLTINHYVGGILSIIYPDLNQRMLALSNIINLGFIISATVLISLLIVAVIYIRKKPVISFCILWFFIALLPVSNIVPQVFVMAERYLYIASIGSCLLIALAIFKIYSLNNKLKYISIALALAILISFSFLTIQRNSEWKDSLTFWSKAVEFAPGSILAHNNLGKVYFDSRRLDDALIHYKLAVKLNPSYADSYSRLGAAYASKGELDLAIESLNKAISLNPALAEAHNNLALVLSQQGNFDQAIYEYRNALQLDPTSKEAKKNLASVLSIKSTNLGVEYKENGNVELAVQEYNKAIEYDSSNIIAHYNLGNAYSYLNKHELAAKEYEKVILVSQDTSTAKNIYYDNELINSVVKHARLKLSMITKG